MAGREHCGPRLESVMHSRDLPLAELQSISLGRLSRGDNTEAERLFTACKTSGFFYLDFSASGNEFFDEAFVDRMFRLDEALFALPSDELLSYDVDKLHRLKLNGYKPRGRNFGGLDGKDGFETYAIPCKGIMGLSAEPFAYPPLIVDNLPLLKGLTQHIKSAAQAIFRSLSTSLDLPGSHGLQNLHRPEAPSPDIVRLLKYARQPAAERRAPHTPHTDLGSLTFLFTREPGLQILPPGAQTWEYVPPRPSCAVVNLGDTMSLFTNGLFTSCLHRVSPLPGRAMPERYSFAYMMRAEDDTRLEGLPSPLAPEVPKHGLQVGLTSREWIERKFANFRVVSRNSEGDWTTTGSRADLPD